MAFDKGQNALTPQEQRILELSAEGHKNSAIAITLSISPETVRWHKRRLYRKIGRGGLPRFPQAVDVIRPITAAG
jgi:LuxR family maltose regulon positive regulatory protein